MSAHDLHERSTHCGAAGARPQAVESCQYDQMWIEETWGWDTPERFLATQGRNLRPRIVESLRLARLRPGMRILDIGCGRGEVVLECARRGIDAVGVDYSPDVIELAEQAKATHTAEERARMQFVCGDIGVLESSQSFDRIFMLDFVEHLHDWELEGVFAACDRLLAPDGVIVIHTLPNKWVYEITYRRLVRLLMPWLPANPRTQKEMSIHVNEMTITHLNRLLDRAGFEAKVWLKDMIVQQARWHRRQPLADRRGKLYRWLANPIVGSLFTCVAVTPLRLLVVNDIFAVATKRGDQLRLKVPSRLCERLATRLAA